MATGNASVDYTLAHLAWLDLLIRREVLRLRLRNGERADEEYRGLYVSDDEVDQLLGQQAPAGRPEAAIHADDSIRRLSDALAAEESRLATLEGEARARGVTLTLHRLVALFGLSVFELRVILICLAAEIDLKYERLFAYLQDDVTKKRPTVDLVLRLLCPDAGARLAARSAFDRDAPLLTWDLVALHDDPGVRKPVLLARYLKLDERIADYLLGSDAPDHRLARYEAAGGSDVPLPDDLARRLVNWSRAWPPAWEETPPIVLFHGRYGVGRRAAARMLAAQLGRHLLLLDAGALAMGDLPIEQGLRLAQREALLAGAVLGWVGADAFLEPAQASDDEPTRRAFLAALARNRTPVVLITAKPWEPARDLTGRPFLSAELSEPGYAERRVMWEHALTHRNGGESLTPAQLESLAGRFRLTAGQIQDAIARAHMLAWSRDPAQADLRLNDIDAACRSQAQHRLAALARKLEPRHTWDDIVLPRGQLAALRLMSTTLRHRPTVYGDWGFDRKLAMGKGLIALFAGPSGTGKTMAAGILAHDLGLDLYKIDLSGVVSKYIGETEKNLERIFGEAQDSNAILFFDEADALFGKRSEVKDAHDRYANIEIAYLLQRTEEYSGLVILASNVKKNMDEAFVRRLHFTVDFPFPEEAERLEIWRRTFPAEAPCASDIDLPFLARKLRIAGGNIRNVILAAAFLAAEEGSPIAMRHLVKGATYEFQKMGKLVVEADFERYFELAKA